jgi:DNA-binding MarR family transcriptional regulator
MKQDLRLKKIRDYLLTHDKATPSEIAKETGIMQPKELADDFKKLSRRGEIVWEEDPKDRRKRWYRLKRKDKALAESRRYDVVKYIESMREPFFAEAKAGEDDYKVLASIFYEGPVTSVIKESKKTEECKKFLQEKLEEASKTLVGTMRTHDIFEPYLNTKMVVVWAYEVPEEKAKKNFDRVWQESLKQSRKKEEK